MNEHLPSFEFSEEEQELITLLKGKTMEEAAHEARFLEWIEMQELVADAEGISSANIKCNLKVARLKVACGFLTEARIDLLDISYMAMQEGEADLLAQAERLLDETES